MKDEEMRDKNQMGRIGDTERRKDEEIRR